MLPVNVFVGSTHYVLVRDGTKVARDGEPVERHRARAVLETALRRGEPILLRDLAALLDLRGHDREHIATRTLARIDAVGGDLVLIRVRKHVVGGRRTPVLERPEEYEAVENEIETHWIEVQLLSDDNPPEPIPRARYEIELPNGQIVRGVLDDAGMVRLDGIPPGECKVSFPDYAEPDPEGDVELEDEAGPAPNTCEISRFEVGCEHAGKRGHKLSLPARKQPGEHARVLEVLGAAAGEGDRIEAKTTMLGPRCSEHATTGIEVLRPRPAEALLFAEEQCQFNAYYGDISLGDRIWPWDLEPTEYRVRPIACDAHPRHEAIIRVYPDYEVALKISAGLDGDKPDGAGAKWSVEIEGSVSYGSAVTKLSKSFEPKLLELESFNRWLESALEQFCAIFKRYFGLELEPELPSVALEYNGKFVELDSAKVGPEWSFKLDADPVVGLTLRLDILDAMIRALQGVPALTAVMAFLRKARDLAKRSGNTLELFASFGGRVCFEAEASKNAGDERTQTSAKGRGQLTVGFEAKAEASVDVLWLVSFSAGASLEGATGLSIDPGIASDDEGLALTADLTLLELKFEYGAYASGKFSWESGATKGGVGGSHTFWEDKLLMEGKKTIVRYDGAGAGQ